MKTNALIIALLVCLPLVASEIQTGPVYEVSLLKYEPVPAKPGDTIDVWIQVWNRGGSAASNLDLYVDDSYPFTPVGLTDSRVGIGTLAAQGQYVAKIAVAVDRSAANGEFILHTRVSTNDRDFTQFDLPIEVESTNAALTVLAARTQPAELIPGSRSTLNITVANVESALLRDLTITLDLDDSVFAPLDGTNQQKISRLEGGRQATFTFNILAEPNAASSVYRIPVAISFTTNDGTTRTQNETIGLVVRAAPDLSLIVDETSVYQGDEQGAVLLRLINKGLSEIKFADVTLESGEGYALAGSSPTVYVGNIDSDDFETIEYAIKPSENDFSLQLVVRYRDALNSAYEERVMLPITLQEQPESGGSGSVVLIVIVLAIVAFIGYRVYKGRRKR